MTRSSRYLCVFYAAIALLALYGTWSENIAYSGSPLHMFGAFLADLKINPASRSISIDIVLFLLAAAFFMVREARRTGIRLVWIYIVLSLIVAVSVMFPLFLIARELRLAQPVPAPIVSRHVATADAAGLAVLTALTVYLAVWLH